MEEEDKYEEEYEEQHQQQMQPRLQERYQRPEFNPYTWRLPETSKRVWDDPAQKCKTNHPESIITKVLTNAHQKAIERDADKFLSTAPGKTLSPLNDQHAIRRIKQSSGLSMFGDYDRDGVPNILDCNPRNKNKQGAFHEGWKEYWGEWGKFGKDVGIGTGKKKMTTDKYSQLSMGADPNKRNRGFYQMMGMPQPKQEKEFVTKYRTFTRNGVTVTTKRKYKNNKKENSTQKVKNILGF